LTMPGDYLKSVRFERPHRIPMTFHVNAACWQHYPQSRLWDLMESHPLFFPGFVRPFSPVARRNTPYTDDWGCVWETGRRSPRTGRRTPSGARGLGRSFAAARVEGRTTHGGLRHGHTFPQLADIRGYENLLYDWIAERFAGRLCVELDIDRQSITRFGTPEQIDALIREGGADGCDGAVPGVLPQ
jgi:uroporphyrinogen decarboxylase